jgi:hypothetical protein
MQGRNQTDTPSATRLRQHDSGAANGGPCRAEKWWTVPRPKPWLGWQLNPASASESRWLLGSAERLCDEIPVTPVERVAHLRPLL